jgi:hypothetical protein
MQKGILIKDGPTVVEKRVYGGDLSEAKMSAEVDRLRSLHPTHSITVYASDQDAEFVEA